MLELIKIKKFGLRLNNKNIKIWNFFQAVHINNYFIMQGGFFLEVIFRF